MRKLVVLAMLVAAVLAFAACEEEDDDGDSNGDAVTATQADGGGATPGASGDVPTPPPGATVTASGLQIVDITVGDGAEAQASSTVTVHYTGTLLDGTEFDSSVGGDPVPFALADLIPAWQEGIPGMKVGGSRQLIVPPELGYGSTGQGAIPPNAWLVFEIELIAVA
jgi:FKBP-type peptidyl-prolyl cis-trans isomerase